MRTSSSHPEAEPGNKILEAQADAFAAAFLMPREYIYAQLPRRVDFRRLLELKLQWGVSLGALLYRARTLGVIGESSYRRAMARMSSEGWRRDEPGDLGASEIPTMLSQALELLRLRGMTLETLAAEARLPLAIVAEIVGGENRPRLSARRWRGRHGGRLREVRRPRCSGCRTGASVGDWCSRAAGAVKSMGEPGVAIGRSPSYD